MHDHTRIIVNVFLYEGKRKGEFNYTAHTFVLFVKTLVFLVLKIFAVNTYSVKHYRPLTANRCYAYALAVFVVRGDWGRGLFYLCIRSLYT